MAAGDGFKQVPFGFDKSEVNAYISDLRKKMNSLEADMKKNNDKTKAAEKLAEEADSRIKAAKAEAQKKVDEIAARLDEEKASVSRQAVEIRNLKDRIDAEKKKMTNILKSGKGVSAEASRAFNEALQKANEEAEEIVEDAKKQAAEIIAEAERQKSETAKKTEEFLERLHAQLEVMGSSYKSIGDCAFELLGIQAVPAFEFAQPAPAAEAAQPAPAPAPAEEEKPEQEEEEEAAVVPDMSVFDSVQDEEEKEESVPETEPASEPAAKEEVPDSLDEEWGGNDMAKAVAAAEKQASGGKGKGKVPLVNPDSSQDSFGGDLFNMDDSTDTDNIFNMDDGSVVNKVEPLDVSDHAEASYDNDFDRDLLAQTMPSKSLENDADADLLEAVKAAEAAAAVKPSDIDMEDNSTDFSSGLSEEDELMKALREAEEALNSVNAASMQSSDASADDTADSSSSIDDPWADLQKQLEAMESANGTDSVISYDEPEKQEEPSVDNAASEPPSADDSSIWDFGDTSMDSSSDDDMSSDFGGFGGF